MKDHIFEQAVEKKSYLDSAGPIVGPGSTKKIVESYKVTMRCNGCDSEFTLWQSEAPKSLMTHMIEDMRQRGFLLDDCDEMKKLNQVREIQES